MMLFNSSDSYGAVARSLHWSMAALILLNIGLGLYAEDLPQASGEEVAYLFHVFSLHKTIGIFVLVLAVVRISWALCQTRPQPIKPGRHVEVWLSKAVHWSLYIATLAVPLTGWLSHAASEGFAPILWPFGQSLPLLPKSPAAAAMFASVHGATTKLLVLSVIVHIAGAAKHVLVDRDGLVQRMITGRPAGGGPARNAPSAASTATVAWAFVIVLGVMIAPRLPQTPDLSATQDAPAGSWSIETGSITFSVRQMQSEVTGTFTGWSADIGYDETSRQGQVVVTIPLNQMSLGAVTAQAAGPEFFDIANHPTALFRAEIGDVDGGLAAKGTLTLRGSKVPVTLPFILTIDGTRAEASGEVVLDRRDFGMGPGFPDETTVGFAVRVRIALSANRR